MNLTPSQLRSGGGACEWCEPIRGCHGNWTGFSPTPSLKRMLRPGAGSRNGFPLGCRRLGNLNSRDSWPCQDPGAGGRVAKNLALGARHKVHKWRACLWLCELGKSPTLGDLRTPAKEIKQPSCSRSHSALSICVWTSSLPVGTVF